MRKYLLLLALAAACTPSKEIKSIGSIEKIDPALDEVIGSNATIEIVAEGFEWSEGPVWVEKEKMLLFTDVPNNVVHKWTEEKGLETYLTPSGYTGADTTLNEPGANGLLLRNDSLLLCQHGNRSVAKMNAALNNPTPDFTVLASSYSGKRFSSPNDAALRNNGDIFFTDPPYGLPQGDQDSTKETSFNGVYRISNGSVSLLVDSLTRPNGIAFTRDQKKVIVANSDPAKAIWYEFEINEKDSLQNARVFYDATALTATEKGLPDGLRVNKQGVVFATGPGGIWIFDATGKVLGKIKLPDATSNCALSADEKTLFITNDMYLVRVKLK